MPPETDRNGHNGVRGFWREVAPLLQAYAVFVVFLLLLYLVGKLVDVLFHAASPYVVVADRCLLGLAVALHVLTAVALLLWSFGQNVARPLAWLWAKLRPALAPPATTPAHPSPSPSEEPAPSPLAERPPAVCETVAPQPVETFVGREHFIATVIEAVRAHRVVTLCGLGGIGKTEVARAVCGELAGQGWPPGGVAYVDLQATTSGDSAAAEIQACLNLSPFSDFRGLASQLQGDRLYVLDDLFPAHANDPDGARALVRTLYQHTTDARFLLTSRDVIGLPGIEQEVRVPTLEPEASEALFRAEAEACGYQWAEDDDERLRSLLQDLDGWPLAMALAARQLGVLGSLATLVEEWRARKTAALKVGTGEDRNINVDASLRLSYDNLPAWDPDDGASPESAARGLFRLFSALPAGATPDLLRGVLGQRGVPAAALLVRRGFANQTGDRFTMLMPVRGFAEALPEPGLDELTARLNVYLLELAEGWCRDDEVWFTRQGEAVRALAADLPNLHRALDAAAATQNPTFVARLTNAVGRFYPFAVPGREAISRLRAGATAADLLDERRHQAECLQCLGDVHRMLDEYSEARAEYGVALPLYRKIGDRRGEADCIRKLGDVHRMVDEQPAARRRYAAALRLYQETRDPAGEASCKKGLGDVDLHSGDYPRARDRFSAALTLFRRLGDRVGEGDATLRLGDVHFQLGEYARARRRYLAALSIYQVIASRLGQANCGRRLGDVHRMLGEHALARVEYTAASRLYREIGCRVGEATCMQGLGDVHHRLAEHPAARREYEAALALFRLIADRQGEADCLTRLGDVERALGGWAAARGHYAAALRIFEEVAYRNAQAGCHQRLGLLAMAQGHTEEGISEMDRAAALFDACGVEVHADRCRKQADEWRQEA